MGPNGTGFTDRGLLSPNSVNADNRYFNLFLFLFILCLLYVICIHKSIYLQKNIFCQGLLSPNTINADHRWFSFTFTYIYPIYL